MCNIQHQYVCLQHSGRWEICSWVYGMDLMCLCGALRWGLWLPCVSRENEGDWSQSQISTGKCAASPQPYGHPMILRDTRLEETQCMKSMHLFVMRVGIHHIWSDPQCYRILCIKLQKVVPGPYRRPVTFHSCLRPSCVPDCFCGPLLPPEIHCTPRFEGKKKTC